MEWNWKNIYRGNPGSHIYMSVRGRTLERGTSGEEMPPGRGLAGGMKLERKNTGGGKVGARIKWKGLEGREGRINPRKRL